jgi:hypothetical protein
VVRGGEGARPVDAYLEDVLPEEGDGREDLVVDFPIKDTDLHSDVERVRLEGETNEGEPLFGDLDVEIVGEE